MFKFLYLFLLLSIYSLLGQDAAVTISDSLVEFGDVLCYELHTETLILTNNSDEPVQVLSAEFSGQEFSTSLQAVEIAVGGAHNFDVYFQADQNVDYTDFLHIVLDSGNRPLIVKVTASAIYENSYYATTQNLWGSELKAALHNIIDGHTELSYTPGVWNALKNSDEDPDNPDNVILLYTGWSYAKVDQNTGDQNGWNREHVWAKAHGDFGTSAPAGTDVHHLRPTDVTVNGARGNLDFDDGGNLYTDDDGATECRLDGDSWEARDLEKGDVARMMYYMVVRYEGDDTSYDLELVDFTPSTLSGEPYFGKQSTLYDWHMLDAVNDWERRRNDRIYTNWQHNRNPFIDYPEFAARMPSISGVDLAEEPDIAVSPAVINLGAIGLNSSISYYIAISNSGNQQLNISPILSSSPDFGLSESSLSISSEDYTYLVVTFESSEADGDFSTVVTIVSNDPDNGTIDIPVSVTVSGLVGIAEGSTTPFSFQLEQNYPNPFNPETTINFQLPIANSVNLSVYNILGQKVANLVSGQQAAGEHKINWHANGFPSGLYFYQLKAGKYSEIRKMMLLQ